MKTFQERMRAANYNYGIVSLSNMENSYIQIHTGFFFCKRVNEFGDMVLQSVSENDFTTIAHVRACGVKKNYFEIIFHYQGIPCRQRIKYVDVKKTTDIS